MTRQMLTTAEAADLLELGGERVRQLVKAGYIPRDAKNKIPLAGAVRGYIRFLKDDTRRTSKSASASRVQDARAREIDLKVAEREGRLVDIVEHTDIFSEAFGAIKSGLASVPARVTAEVAQRRKIEVEIDAVLQRAADRFEQATSDLASGGAPAAADEGDDA